MSTAPSTSVPVDPTRVMTGRLVARVNQTVELGGGARLVVDKVNDSRCPPDVQCASAGDLDAEVRWIDASGEQTLRPKWSYHALPVAVAGMKRYLTIVDMAAVGGNGEAVLWIVDDPCAPVEGRKPSQC